MLQEFGWSCAHAEMFASPRKEIVFSLSCFRISALRKREDEEEYFSGCCHASVILISVLHALCMKSISLQIPLVHST